MSEIMGEFKETLDPVELSTKPKILRLVDSQMETKDYGDSMVMSGYVSTGVPDLVNDKVPPSAFSKYLQRYKNNPVYCYNHDHFTPIGKVRNVEITEKGLYLDEIKLTNIPVVKEIIWPLVKDGVLKQQSIGFLSLDGDWDGKFYVHKEIYLLECSLVTVACNPEAEIDRVKSIPGFEQYKNLNDLIRGYTTGKVRLPSEISKQFHIMNNPLGESKVNNAHPLTPDFVDVTAIKNVDTSLYDPEGEIVPKPNRIHKNYSKVSELIHAAKRVVDGKDVYMFEIGVPTTKGFRYDWDKTAMTVCRILGAKGVANYTPNEKLGILERVAEVYETLGKAMPTYEGVVVSDLNPDVLSEVKFSEIVFSEGEKDILNATILESDITSVENVIKSYVEKGSIPENVQTQLKRLRAYVDVFGVINSAEDAEAAANLLSLVVASATVNEVPAEGAYSGRSINDAETKENDEFSIQVYQSLKEYIEIQKQNE
jgi:HK97 family phage prohead protease